jgi:hypothetical protein
MTGYPQRDKPTPGNLETFAGTLQATGQGASLPWRWWTNIGGETVELRLPAQVLLTHHWHELGQQTPDGVTPKLMLVRCRKCKHSEEWPFQARWMLRPREYRCS